MVKLLKNHALKFFLVFAILLVFLSSAFAHKLIPEEPQSPHESYTLTGKVVAEQVLSCGESRGVERYGVIQVPLSKGLAENLGKRFKSFIFEKYSKEFYVPEKIKAACVEAKKMCVSDMLKVTSQFSCQNACPRSVGAISYSDCTVAVQKRYSDGYPEMLTSSVSCSNKVSCEEVQGPPPPLPPIIESPAPVEPTPQEVELKPAPEKPIAPKPEEKTEGESAGPTSGEGEAEPTPKAPEPEKETETPTLKEGAEEDEAEEEEVAEKEVSKPTAQAGAGEQLSPPPPSAPGCQIEPPEGRLTEEIPATNAGNYKHDAKVPEFVVQYADLTTPGTYKSRFFKPEDVTDSFLKTRCEGELSSCKEYVKNRMGYESMCTPVSKCEKVSLDPEGYCTMDVVVSGVTAWWKFGFGQKDSSVSIGAYCYGDVSCKEVKKEIPRIPPFERPEGEPTTACFVCDGAGGYTIISITGDKCSPPAYFSTVTEAAIGCEIKCFTCDGAGGVRAVGKEECNTVSPKFSTEKDAESSCKTACYACNPSGGISKLTIEECESASPRFDTEQEAQESCPVCWTCNKDTGDVSELKSKKACEMVTGSSVHYSRAEADAACKKEVVCFVCEESPRGYLSMKLPQQYNDCASYGAKYTDRKIFADETKAIVACNIQKQVEYRGKDCPPNTGYFAGTNPLTNQPICLCPEGMQKGADGVCFVAAIRVPFGGVFIPPTPPPTTTEPVAPALRIGLPGPALEESCGNGKVDLGELCDPPGSVGSVSVDGEFICGSYCQWVYVPLPQPVCGNKKVESGEECDPPTLGRVGDKFMCNTNCKLVVLPVCGDGKRTGFEVCDGADGCASPAQCRNDCQQCITPAILVPHAPPLCEEGEDYRTRNCRCESPMTMLNYICSTQKTVVSGPGLIYVPGVPTPDLSGTSESGSVYAYARVVADIFSSTGAFFANYFIHNDLTGLQIGNIDKFCAANTCELGSSLVGQSCWVEGYEGVCKPTGTRDAESVFQDCFCEKKEKRKNVCSKGVSPVNVEQCAGKIVGSNCETVDYFGICKPMKGPLVSSDGEDVVNCGCSYAEQKPGKSVSLCSEFISEPSCSFKTVGDLCTKENKNGQCETVDERDFYGLSKCACKLFEYEKEPKLIFEAARPEKFQCGGPFTSEYLKQNTFQKIDAGLVYADKNGNLGPAENTPQCKKARSECIISNINKIAGLKPDFCPEECPESFDASKIICKYDQINTRQVGVLWWARDIVDSASVKADCFADTLYCKKKIEEKPVHVPEIEPAGPTSGEGEAEPTQKAPEESPLCWPELPSDGRCIDKRVNDACVYSGSVSGVCKSDKTIYSQGKDWPVCYCELEKETSFKAGEEDVKIKGVLAFRPATAVLTFADKLILKQVKEAKIKAQVKELSFNPEDFDAVKVEGKLDAGVYGTYTRTSDGGAKFESADREVSALLTPRKDCPRYHVSERTPSFAGRLSTRSIERPEVTEEHFILACGESRGVERYGVKQVTLSEALARNLNLGKRFKSFIFEKYSKEFYVPEKIKAACVEAKKMCVSDMLKVTSQFSCQNACPRSVGAISYSDCTVAVQTRDSDGYPEMLTSSVSCSNKVSCEEVQGPPPGIPSVELPLGEPTPEEEKPKAVAREGRLPEPKIKKPPIFEKPTVESLKINCGSTKAGVGVSKVNFGGYTDVRKVYEDYPDIANVVKASSKSDALNQINYYYICSDDRCEKTYKICSDPLITTLPENDNMVVSSKCSFSVTCSEISEQPTIPVLRTEQEIPPFTPSFWPSGPAPAGEGETSGKEFYTPYCGDFKKDLGEDCDPPGSVSVDGKFICGSDCQWFVSSIVGVPGQVYGPLPQPVCGNGVKEGAEVCDGSVGCASGQSCSNDCKSCFTPAISLPSAPPVCEEGEDVRYCVCNMFNSLGHCCPANTYWNGVQCAAYLAGGPTIIGAPPTPTYTYARVVANLFSATGKSIMSFTGMQSFAAKGEGAGRQVLDPACAPTVLMSRVKEVECSVGETKLEKGWVWDTCYECVKTPLWPAQWRSTDMSRCEGQKPPEKEVERPQAPPGERPPERRSPIPLGELPGRPGSGLLPLEGSECSEGDIKCESEDGGCYYQTCVNGKFTSKDYVSTSCEEFLPGRVCSSKTIKPQTSPPGERPSPPPAPKEEPRGLPLSGEPAERRVSDEKVCKNGATRKCKIVKGTEGAVCNYEVCKKNQWVYDSVVIPPDAVDEEYCSC